MSSIVNIFNLIKSVLFNPYIVGFRFWNVIYKSYYKVFDITPLNDHDNLRKSYLLTVCYSLLCTLSSPYSFYLLIWMNPNWFLTYISNTFYYMSVTYFISDLYHGWYYYKNILDNSFLLSYFHHTVYVGLFAYCNYYDKLNYCLLGIPFEIPSVVRSLGYINKDFKDNKLFGQLFFIFRIIYNIVLLVYFYKIKLFDFFIFGSATMTLHSYWFYGYLVKYKII